MSAVEDVAARVQRLQETLALKRAQLQRLHLQSRYNPSLGVDEDIDSGASVAALEVRVVGARGVAFGSGFLSGKATYVRVSLATEGHGGAQHRTTTKRPIDQPLRWQETVVFNAVASASGILRVDVMQEERIGADSSVGGLTMPLMGLYDQRTMDKWQALARGTDNVPNGDIHLCCRFQRSQISAMELEVELMQNQVKELHEFMSRHQHQFSHHHRQPLLSSRHSSSASMFASVSCCVALLCVVSRYALLLLLPAVDHVQFPAKPLEGKEVVVPSAMSDVRRTLSTRFSKVESYNFASPESATKREVTMVDAYAADSSAPSAKRQRFDGVARPGVSSFSDRLANWLLPANFASPKPGSAATPTMDERSSQFFPFKQRATQTTDARRPPKRSNRPSALSKAPASSSALQAIEQWFFTDKDGNPRASPFPSKAPFS